MQRISVVAALLMVFSFVFGCAEAPPQKKAEEEKEIVWPKPPDKARIKYIKSYNNTFDVEDAPGFMDQIAGINYYSLEAPQGVAADREGNIYVSDSTRSVIVVFKPQKKKLDFMGHLGREIVSVPIGITIANDMNMLLVASSGNKKVIGYDLKSGNPKLVISGFENPVGVAIDEKKGRIYVADSKSHDVKAFDTNGRYISTLATRGAAENQVTTPSQVSVDSKGNVYVADLFNFRIKVFSPEGKFLKSIGHGPCTGIGCFSKVNGVGVDSEGHIYGVDTDFAVVQIFNEKGDLLLPFAGLGTIPGRLFLPMHIYIDENDRIYVADTWNYRISVFQYLKE